MTSKPDFCPVCGAGLSPIMAQCPCVVAAAKRREDFEITPEMLARFADMPQPLDDPDEYAGEYGNPPKPIKNDKPTEQRAERTDR